MTDERTSDETRLAAALLAFEADRLAGHVEAEIARIAAAPDATARARAFAAAMVIAAAHLARELEGPTDAAGHLRRMADHLDAQAAQAH